MLKISITNRRNKIKSRLLSSSSSSSLSWTWCSNQELLAAQAVLYAVHSQQPTHHPLSATHQPTSTQFTHEPLSFTKPSLPLKKLSLSQNAIARILHDNDHQYLHNHPSLCSRNVLCIFLSFSTVFL